VAPANWKKKLKSLGLSRKRRAPGTAPVPRPSAKRAWGDAGEEIATAFLVKRGLKVLERNVRYKDGELDVVARTEATLVFVEVKRRRDAERGGAAESVTPLKRARVLRAARRWLAENPERRAPDVRFDVIAIEDEPFRIDWIQGAFDAR
jgi:putative endonuclease